MAVGCDATWRVLAIAVIHLLTSAIYLAPALTLATPGILPYLKYCVLYVLLQYQIGFSVITG